ncbi:MAG TPA: protein kinase family protein, partial [Actinoplanes sp.]|nr:protein kinase family protein [Actinoplanes sp.]
MTFGAPTVGEILAERYRLEEHINNDRAGRQVWRGMDVILRRPVAVVLRHPGGESATEMLQAAVDASRVIHPNLVGVYDAIDEGERAYVVREWVDGEALREVVTASGPTDPQRATTIVRSITDALAAVHATGMVHGNLHPGTVLIGDDGRIVLADARADASDTHESDVRSIGGILYYALTGHWPHAEAGPSALPDAVRDGGGGIAAPRQVRAGIPAYLDDLTMDLLDSRIAAPDAEVLAAELGRLDSAEEEY